MPKVWRLNIKPDFNKEVDPRKFCLDKGLLGVGWAVDADTEADWETYRTLAEERYYKQGDKGWWPAINAIKNRMALNDLCWTRDWNGVYYLGRITGDWIYQGSKENIDADIVNVRSCDWERVGPCNNVPGKVLNSFIPPRTVQEIADETVSIFSQHLLNTLLGNSHYSIPKLKGDIFSLLTSDDCEDAVGLYMQAQGYSLVPSTCKSDTLAYEFVMIHRETGKTALAQVKNGYVDLDMGGYGSMREDVFLFTSKGQYVGEPYSHVHCIGRAELEDFIRGHLSLMPRIKALIEFLDVVGS